MKKKKESKRPKRPASEPCYFCGSENIEQIYIHDVGVVRICKECKEQQ